VIKDSKQRRYSGAVGLTLLTARLVSLSLHLDSWRAGNLSFWERGGNLSCQVTFGLLAPSKSPHGHVVLHHGAFVQLVPNGVCMIEAGGLKKLLEVISGLPHLALEVTLSSGDELLVGVTDLLVIVTLIAVGSDHDLLGLLFRAPLYILASCL
jgi:hypothetical protein